MGRKRVLDAESLGYGCHHSNTGWTIDTLHEHFTTRLAEKDLRDQQRFEAQSSAIAAALLAAEKAVSKAETASEKRFESVNEFRAQLADLVARLLPRIEYDAAHAAVIERISDLASRIDKTEGRSTGLNAGWGYLVAAAAIVIAIISWITR